jgi:hypothetical protein
MGSLPETGPISVGDVATLFDLPRSQIGFDVFRTLNIDVPGEGPVSMGMLRGKSRPALSRFTVSMADLNTGLQQTWKGSAEGGTNFVRLRTGTPLEFTLRTGSSVFGGGRGSSPAFYALACLTEPFKNLCVCMQNDVLVLTTFARLDARFSFRIVAFDGAYRIALYSGTPGAEWPYQGNWLFGRYWDDYVGRTDWSEDSRLTTAQLAGETLPSASLISSVAGPGASTRQYPPRAIIEDSVNIFAAYGSGTYSVSSSSTSTSVDSANLWRRGWCAFDRNQDQFFQGAGSGSTAFVTLSMPVAIQLQSYKITATKRAAFTGRTPRFWQIDGSNNNGANWTRLSTVYDAPAWRDPGETRTYTDITNTAAFRMLRYYTWVANPISLGELAYFGVSVA